MITRLTILNQTSIPVAAKGLDAATLRGRAIADNFANITTPGYRRIEVKFEEELRKALDETTPMGNRTSPNHLYHDRLPVEMVNPIAVRSEDPTKPGEVNNVDVDLEAAALAETQISFNMGVRFIRDRLETLSKAGKAP